MQELIGAVLTVAGGGWLIWRIWRVPDPEMRFEEPPAED